MKGTFAKGFKTLVAGFVLLAGLFLTANRAEAQQLTTKQQVQQSYNFVSASDAIERCKDQVEFWHGQLANAAPNTNPYYNALRHAAYFKAVSNALNEGQSVLAALNQGLGLAATLGGSKEASFTPGPVLRALFEEGVDVMTD